MYKKVSWDYATALGKSEELASVRPPVSDERKTHCSQCQTQFGSWLNATKGQLQCPLCLDVLCAACLSCFVPLEPSIHESILLRAQQLQKQQKSSKSSSLLESNLSAETLLEKSKITFPICKRCNSLLFDPLESPSPPPNQLCKLYSISVEIRTAIDKLLTKLAERIGRLYDTDDITVVPADLGAAKKNVSLLKEFFLNFETAVKSISQLKISGSRTAQMTRNILFSLRAWSQQRLPRFRLLAEGGGGGMEDSFLRRRSRESGVFSKVRSWP